MTSFIHISDTHGTLPVLTGLDEVDFVVHSGDFMPNRTRGLRVIEESFQEAWLEKEADRIRQWLGGKPLLLVPGNHDFIDPTAVLGFREVNAILLDDRAVGLGGLYFWGHKWTPYFTGEWAWEESEAALRARLDIVPAHVNVMVSHGPPYGVLDRNARGQRCGSVALRHWLQDRGESVKACLVGHIHEAGGGVVTWPSGLLVSNAATSQRIITL